MIIYINEHTSCHSSGYVFRKETTGKPHKPDYLTNKYKNLLKGIPEGEQTENLMKSSFHTTRHTHATELFGVGIQPKIIQERLGHSSIAVTMNIYSHLMPNMQQSAMMRFKLDYEAWTGDPVELAVAERN
tara:strand:+ start:70 stop:459 length:390 start_codon:yes stop_codon:yes gene_type:complete